MKIVSINVLPTGSPATIMRGISEEAVKRINAECYSFYGNWKGSPRELNGSKRFGIREENYISTIIGKYFGIHNMGSLIGTMMLLREIEKINPDIIHLHNLHLNCINVPMLFNYIKRKGIRIIWTLHDCWAFTGRCPYFQVSGCDKWKTGCSCCVYPCKDYPESLVDRTSYMWKKKRKWFSNVKNLTIVTPSEWLAEKVSESFLQGYPVHVINNGIDLEVFRKTETNFREKHDIQKSKILLLGVALNWSEYKGLDVFVELSQKLEEKYQILLVGVDDYIKKKLPPSIIAINKTQNVKELIEIYTAADIMINPTREENYPTVCMECIACGTPIISFDTGGCKEIITPATGYITKEKNADSIIQALKYYEKNGLPSTEECIDRSKFFDRKNKYLDYIKLYKTSE